MEARLSAQRMFAELSGPLDGERERILNAFLEGVDPILQVVLAPQSQLADSEPSRSPTSSPAASPTCLPVPTLPKPRPTRLASWRSRSATSRLDQRPPPRGPCGFTRLGLPSMRWNDADVLLRSPSTNSLKGRPTRPHRRTARSRWPSCGGGPGVRFARGSRRSPALVERRTRARPTQPRADWARSARNAAS
jgi:hypothetical protein